MSLPLDPSAQPDPSEAHIEQVPQSPRGIGNEIAFYIFDYAPEDEMHIREHIRFLLDHLPKHPARSSCGPRQPL